MRSDQGAVSAVLLEKGGRFYVYEPGLGVIASGDSVESAYGKFSEARRGYIAEVARAGLDASRPAPQPTELSLRRNVRGELAVFLAKTCIVFAAIALVLGPVAIGLGRSIGKAGAGIGEALGAVGSLSLVDVVRKAADVARDAQDLPEDKKEQLRQSIGVVSRELAPFVEAWRNPPEPKAPPPGRPAR